MRALVQRVRSASVEVKEEIISSIGVGFLVLIGVKSDDTPEAAEALSSKLQGLRIFEDERGKMNLSIAEVKGEMLVVSQFTLYADTRKGRRPSFTECAPAAVSKPLYDRFISCLRAAGVPLQEGIFGAEMRVKLENEGPVTFIVET